MSFISDLLINVSAFRITVGNKINALATRIGVLTSLTTTDKSNIVSAINEVNGKNITIGTGMGELKQDNGSSIYLNSIAISNKQDANTHPKNSGGLEAFSYNAPSAINYPVVTGAGGGGGISFYRNNSAGGLLSSFDIVKAEHSEEKLRFRVGISNTAKGGWKTFASEEYVNDVIAGLGIENIGARNFLVNSNNFINISPWGAYTQTTLSVENKYLKVVGGSSGTPRFRNNSVSSMMIYEKERVYFTLSVVYKNSSGQVIGLTGKSSDSITTINENGSQSIGSINKVSTTELDDGWIKDVFEIYAMAETPTIKAGWFSVIVPQNSTFYFRSFKLEKGRVATDWSPSPEDQVPDWNETDNTKFSFVKNKPTLVNNYVDLIQTTNGTTAGTVYTFKRIGLSDLTLTLTAASASFSGVVTTGMQTFEGVKTFLKSPKIPNAVNNDEAVNKAQMDTGDVNGNTAFGWGNFRNYGLADGLSNNPAVTSDLFTIYETGFYRYANTSVNTPNSSNGSMIVMCRNASYIARFAISDSGTIYYTYGNLPSWKYFITEENINGIISTLGYALLSQVYTQAQALGLFVGKTGVETIQDTKTFTHSPIVPNGTLNGHTINLGQLNTILNAYALTSAIPTNNNQLTNGAGYITSAALGGYVQQTSLNTQLANYVTLGSVQTITATKTYTVSPVVPNGTLAGHTVNLGQMQSYVTGFGYTTLTAVQTWVNSQGYLTSSALNGYVLQSSLTAQLANYATLAGTQTFTGQITFNQPPIVPNGSLAGHTVNLGQMQSYVSNAIANIPAQTPNRVYDSTFPINNDYWDKIPIKSVRHDFGFDVCNYEPQTQEYVSIFSNYGAPYLNEGILGSIALMCPHTGVPVIKGTVECQQNLNPYIDNNQIYFCLVYERDTTSPTYLTGSLQMLSIQDIVSHTGSGSVEMFNSIIVLGVATRDNTLMVQHREF